MSSVQDQAAKDEINANFASKSKKEKSQGSSFLQRSRNAIMGAAEAVGRVASKGAGAFAEDSKKTEVLVLAADGVIWSGCSNGLLVHWDGNGNRLQDFHYHPCAFLSLCTDGSRIWVGYISSMVQMLDLEGNLLVGWVAHNGPVVKMVVGESFILATHGGIRGWSLASPGPIDDIIRPELAEKEHVYTRKEDFRILVGTWSGKSFTGSTCSLAWFHSFRCWNSSGWVARSRNGSIPYDEARDFVSQRSFEWLRERDQLREEMKTGKLFQGMCEAIIKFPPTYKFERGKPGLGGYDSGEKKQIPAWCDRVLYRDNRTNPTVECSLGCPVVASIIQKSFGRGSSDLLFLLYPEASLLCDRYEGCMEVTESDHKPVRCKFNVELAHIDRSVRRLEFGKVFQNNDRIRSILDE